MTKKIKLLYDANWLADVFDSRCDGIYFVGFNILKELSKNEKIEIALWAFNQKKLKRFMMQKGFENLTIQKIPLKEHINRKIERLSLKITMRKESNRKLSVISKKAQKFLFDIAHTFIPSKSISSYDMYFSCVFKIPQFIKNTNAKKYLYLHDCIPIVLKDLYAARKDRHLWFYEMCKDLPAEQKLFCNSIATKNDFIKYFPDIPVDKFIVAPLACASNFKPEPRNIEVFKKYNIPTGKKYVFSLCALEPRKNLVMAVSSFIEFVDKNNINDLVFVLGGGTWSDFIGLLEKEIPDLSNHMDKIIKTGYISDEDMSTLYSNAQWFVYTSMYEGFGMPPLEAMSCKTAVITSNNSSLPEVVGDAGIMIDYNSKEQHIKAYETYYYDEEYKNQMAQKGYDRSLSFSWDKCANIIISEMLK